MAGQRITIQIQGADVDKGHLRLSELIKQLELVKTALGNTERLVTGQDERFVYYRVVDLYHKSPATIVIESVGIKPEIDPKIPKQTVNVFFKNLRQIQTRGKVSDEVDLPALESYRNLTSLLEKNVSQLAISNGRSKNAIDLDHKFKERLDKIIGRDELITGSLTGKLEWINIHNTNSFHIYPTIGAKKVTCTFPQSLRRNVIEAIDLYVRVYGILKYKQRDKFPYSIAVEEIETMPLYDKLPTLAALRGIAPEATGEMSASDFVRSLRDAAQ